MSESVDRLFQCVGEFRRTVSRLTEEGYDRTDCMLGLLMAYCDFQCSLFKNGKTNYETWEQCAYAQVIHFRNALKIQAAKGDEG